VNNTDKSAAGSYSSTPDDHESLGADHDWVPVAQAMGTCGTGTLSRHRLVEYEVTLQMGCPF